MKMKVKYLWIENIFPTYLEDDKVINNYEFTVVLKKGLHKKYYKFITSLPYFKIAYLEKMGYENAPTDKKENRKILELVYGEFKKQLAMWELQEDFRKQDEEKERKRKEEEQGKIKVGEQVSFEKYLKTIDNSIN